MLYRRRAAAHSSSLACLASAKTATIPACACGLQELAPEQALSPEETAFVNMLNEVRPQQRQQHVVLCWDQLPVAAGAAVAGYRASWLKLSCRRVLTGSSEQRKQRAMH